jgi:hypothetical protein
MREGRSDRSHMGCPINGVPGTGWKTRHAHQGKLWSTVVSTAGVIGINHQLQVAEDERPPKCREHAAGLGVFREFLGELSLNPGCRATPTSVIRRSQANR